MHMYMVPSFPFNTQYSGFISTKIITYKHIIQLSHISFQFHHAEPYLSNNSKFTIFRNNSCLSSYQYNNSY